MTRTQRRTRIKSGLVAAVALIFLIALLLLSLSWSGGTKQAVASTGYGERSSANTVTIEEGTAAAFVKKTNQSSYKPSGKITSALQLCYVFFCQSATGGTYTLGKNFKIEDSTWADSEPKIKAETISATAVPHC